LYVQGFSFRETRLVIRVVATYNARYYMRNAAISLSESIVRASYNCDGTYIVRADYFPEFVRINTP
jgi:hypothetical protein